MTQIIDISKKNTLHLTFDSYFAFDIAVPSVKLPELIVTHVTKYVHVGYSVPVAYFSYFLFIYLFYLFIYLFLFFIYYYFFFACRLLDLYCELEMGILFFIL